MTRESFQDLLKQSSDKNWEQTEADLAEFYPLISESYHQEPHVFAETMMTWLCQKVGAMMGIFWMFKEESESLHFSAGFACDIVSLSKKIHSKNSNNIFQTVIKNHEVIFIDNLDNFGYQTATYQIPLRSWLILPLLLNDRFLGCIELYHPNQFKAQKLHLLWQAVGAIGAAWSGITEQAHRKRLIEQLHQQNEEITTQEEELRQQTEELIAINENLEEVRLQLKHQNEDILQTKVLIEKKNENIMASIQYAKRIQQAILPSDDNLKKFFGEYALLFLPRDVVSGDFYWTFQNKQGAWIAVADCTGHGVPAAMMSMMGINLLEHTMSNFDSPSPAQVLDYLNKRLQILLRVGETNNKDGMDMSLCLLNPETQKIHFAGAMNSGYYISETGLHRLEHTRMPIGSHIGKQVKKFVNQEVEMSGNGMLYLCSDGFQDQFGGANNKKFMRRKFHALLQEIWYMPADEQTEILRKTFEDWKQDNEQTDDVLVIGIRV